MGANARLGDSLLLDLETALDGRLLKIGAVVRGERTFSRARLSFAGVIHSFTGKQLLKGYCNIW